MKTFFVLIFISFKLIAFPIGDEKTMFSGKSTTIKEYQDLHHTVFLDQELTEIEESEDDSIDDVSDKSSFSIQDFFASIQKESKNINRVNSSPAHSCQQLYKLYQTFLI